MGNSERLNIILTAENKVLQKKIKESQQRVKYFAAKANKDLSTTTKAFNLLGSAAGKVGIALSSGALATGMLRSVDNALKAAVAIGNLSRVAGLSTDAFQKFSHASKTVGIEQSKLSDILKDVNDKFGDYIATGAGPLADFFDNIAPKVGLTKDAFVGLSSDQALGKYVKALQKAGVNQQEMTFYMEALASDATALVPLLADNAAGLTRIGEAAEDAGALLDSGMIKNAENMQKRWTEVLGVMEQHWNTFWLTVGMGIDEIFNASDQAKLRDQQAAVDGATDDLKNYSYALEHFKDVNKNILAGGESPFKANVVTELNTLENNVRAAERAYQTAKDVVDATKQRIADSETIDLPPLVITPGSGTGGTATTIAEVEQIKEAYDRVAASLNPLVGLQAKYKQEQEAINAALAIGHISQEKANDLLGQAKTRYEQASKASSGTGGTASSIAAAEQIIQAYEAVEVALNPLIALTNQYEAQQRSIDDALKAGHISQAHANVLLGQAKTKYQQATGEAINYSSAVDTMASGLENSFMSLVDGSESFADSMKDTAAAVIKELYRVLVVQQLVSAAMGAFGYKKVDGQYVKGNASGGTVQRGTPTLVGEHGPELMVPSSGSRILSKADTMRAMGGGGGVTVHQTINVTTGIQQTVRAEMRNLMPQFVEAAKAGVLSAKKRGGAFGNGLA